MDTVPEGSRIGIYGHIPQPLKVRGKTVWTYDIEMTIMLIKDWAKRGMSRTEIEDLLLETQTWLI